MFFLRKLIWRLVFVWGLGFIVRKLRASDNPKLQRAGATANRAMGGAFGIAPNDPSLQPRKRRGRSIGGAAVGGIMSYFMDPQHGSERRQRAKDFASRQVAKARTNGNGQSASSMTALSPSPVTSTNPAFS